MLYNPHYYDIHYLMDILLQPHHQDPHIHNNKSDGFSVVISCRTLGALKPLPDGLHAAASQLGVPVSELLHVGDRWDTDGRAAAAAGCHFRHIDEIDPHDPLNGLLLACAGKSHSRSQPDTV